MLTPAQSLIEIEGTCKCRMIITHFCTHGWPVFAAVWRREIRAAAERYSYSVAHTRGCWQAAAQRHAHTHSFGAWSPWPMVTALRPVCRLGAGGTRTGCNRRHLRIGFEGSLPLRQRSSLQSLPKQHGHHVRGAAALFTRARDVQTGGSLEG